MDQTGYNEEQVYLWDNLDETRRGRESATRITFVSKTPSTCSASCARTRNCTRFPTGERAHQLPSRKPDRMVSVIAQYWKGEANAIDVWHWGEGGETLTSARAARMTTE